MPGILKEKSGNQCGQSVLRKGRVVGDKVREKWGTGKNVGPCGPLQGLAFYSE